MQAFSSTYSVAVAAELEESRSMTTLAKDARCGSFPMAAVVSGHCEIPCLSCREDTRFGKGGAPEHRRRKPGSYKSGFSEPCAGCADVETKPEPNEVGPVLIRSRSGTSELSAWRRSRYDGSEGCAACGDVVKHS